MSSSYLRFNFFIKQNKFKRLWRFIENFTQILDSDSTKRWQLSKWNLNQCLRSETEFALNFRNRSHNRESVNMNESFISQILKIYFQTPKVNRRAGNTFSTSILLIRHDFEAAMKLTPVDPWRALRFEARNSRGSVHSWRICHEVRSRKRYVKNLT